jgi:hypothetical protein
MKFSLAIPRDINISASANGGLIAHVGCKQFVYTNVDSLLTDLDSYLRDPEHWEKEWDKFIRSEKRNLAYEPIEECHTSTMGAGREPSTTL